VKIIYFQKTFFCDFLKLPVFVERLKFELIKKIPIPIIKGCGHMSAAVCSAGQVGWLPPPSDKTRLKKFYKYFFPFVPCYCIQYQYFIFFHNYWNFKRMAMPLVSIVLPAPLVLFVRFWEVSGFFNLSRLQQSVYTLLNKSEGPPPLCSCTPNGVPVTCLWCGHWPVL